MSIAELGLDAAVARISAATLKLSDDDLARELPDAVMAGEGRWRGYGGVREVVFRVYLELRELAILTAAHRERRGEGITQAQRILAQHHTAWRDLTGVLAGLRDDELDREPAPDEWPVRTVLKHIMDAEAGFTWVVRVALSGQPFPEQRPNVDVSGSLADILGRYGAIHATAIDEFATLTDAQLLSPSHFWEGYPIELRFRLLRFDAHLREHTIQVDKTLAGINHVTPESQRVVRLLHRALAEAEGATIGAWHAAGPERAQLAADIERLAGVISAA